MRVRWCVSSALAALASLFVLALVLGTPARAEGSEETEREASAHADRGAERWAAGEIEEALAAYTAAIEALAAPYLQEENLQAAEIVRLRKEWESATSAEVATELRRLLTTQDALADHIAAWELESARCLVRLGRPEEAVRALGRSLGYDLSLWEQIRGDASFSTLHGLFAYEELAFLATKGRAHLDTSDPAEYAFWERDYRRRLALPPGSAELGGRRGVIGKLQNLISARADGHAPARLDVEEYDRLVRLGMLRPRTHSGWAHRHSHLFEGDRAIRDLQAECQRRFEERRDEPDGPFRCVVAFFPALHLGLTEVFEDHLEYLRARAPLCYDKVLEGMRWLLRTYSENGVALPGRSLADTKELLAETSRAYQALDVESTTLQAWLGYREVMVRYGDFHRLGLRGMARQPERAIAWYEGADTLGVIDARLRLADCYMYGTGVDKNEERGFELCASAADEGDTAAFNHLAYYFQYGLGVERNYTRARALFRKAANDGQDVAMESLGILLHRGLGGEQDYDAARQWYEKSLQAGHARAGRRLGNLAIDARETEADLADAVRVLRRARGDLPDDYLAFLYLWTALQLQGAREEAQAEAASFLEGMEEPGVRQDLVRALAHGKLDTTPLLGKAGQESDEELKRTIVGELHFAQAVKHLAAGERAAAKRSFEKCREQAGEVDSTLHTAIAELRRLEETKD